ncbi:T9SS type A sorting domain-containing protein [Taibaiella chishuiensis]|uniref:Putative secreted protein (Por secretion system target) n=1 Tax=Taibaiella chishuiensis TaxID=1434707 RepID=A0A2P8DCK2_9BACT|nr:T9SS type A sorting domain-containing protein [Taibaiella chishuiensis]PSK94925.1 putative secreted protein (Por secretion system target) [Taibaiella chishuiensis]
MKQVLWILALLFAGWQVNAQVPSSCLTNTELEALYRKDIAHMALVYMYETHASDTTLIDIPQPYIDSVKRAMAAVFNLGAQLEADSVMRRHCIRQDRHMEGFHLSGARNGVNLYVKVDPSKTWTDGWKSLNAVTGYATLDELMAHCGFQVTGFNNTSGTANIKTAEIINGKAFADSLLKLDGILEVSFIPAVGDGNYIRYTYNNGAAHLVFRLGWGDCPSGCTGNKLWYYTVDGQCRVTLDSVRTIQATGTYPVPNNCGITGFRDPQQDIAVAVYPNPTTGGVLLQTSGNKSYDYKLMDQQGRVLLKGKVNSKETLRLDAYAKGIYLLRLSDAGGKGRSEKILLQ